MGADLHARIFLGDKLVSLEMSSIQVYPTLLSNFFSLRLTEPYTNASYDLNAKTTATDFYFYLLSTHTFSKSYFLTANKIWLGLL